MDGTLTTWNITCKEFLPLFARAVPGFCPDSIRAFSLAAYSFLRASESFCPFCPGSWHAGMYWVSFLYPACSVHAAQRTGCSSVPGLIDHTFLCSACPLQEGEQGKSIDHCKAKRFPAMHGYYRTSWTSSYYSTYQISPVFMKIETHTDSLHGYALMCLYDGNWDWTDLNNNYAIFHQAVSNYIYTDGKQGQKGQKLQKTSEKWVMTRRIGFLPYGQKPGMRGARRGRKRAITFPVPLICK